MNGIFDDFKAEFSKRDNTLIQLILVNLVVFVVILLLKITLYFGEVAHVYGWVLTHLSLPASLYSFVYKPWTLLTNFFVHEGVFHILFNMLFLYWFGSLVEEYIGGRRLLSLYILGGLAGGLTFMFLYNVLPYFSASLPSASLYGASGAVYAIIVGAATLLPEHTFSLLLIGPVRIKYIALFYILLSMAELVGSNPGGNIAHLAGALLGFVFIKSLRNGTDLGAPVNATADFITILFKKKPQMRVSYKREASPAPSSRSFYVSGQKPVANATAMPNQDEIDAILDKISKSGYESLSKEEKQRLYKASQQS